MKQHKWHKEIKAWADGADIEFSYFSENGVDVWRETDAPLWNCIEGRIYRIKPQPVEVVASGQPFRFKEKKYLYGYHKNGYPFDISHVVISHVEWLSYQGYEYLGKIEVLYD